MGSDEYIAANQLFTKLKDLKQLDRDGLSSFLQKMGVAERDISRVLQAGNIKNSQLSWPQFIKLYSSISPLIALSARVPSISKNANSCGASKEQKKNVYCWVHGARHLTNHKNPRLSAFDVYCVVGVTPNSNAIKSASNAKKFASVPSLGAAYSNARLKFVRRDTHPEAAIQEYRFCPDPTTKLVVQVYESASRELIGSVTIDFSEASTSVKAATFWKELLNEEGKKAGEVEVSLLWVGKDEKPGDWALPRDLRPKWRDTFAVAKELAENVKDLSANIKALLIKGSTEIPQLPSMSRVVRVFTSSTFTDTAMERNELMLDVYPFLDEVCKQLGLEFEVVDMRWGVREFSTDDHLTGKLCMKELDKCIKRSIGPAFVNLLGDKYGFRPFEPLIEQSKLDKVWPYVCPLEVETIRECIPDHPNLEEIVKIVSTVPLHQIWDTLKRRNFAGVLAIEDLLLIPMWFTLDENAVPPTYVLQSISRHIPGFLSRNSDVAGSSRARWWGIFERLQDLLRTGVSRAGLNEQEKQTYFISVTEEEVHHGILSNTNRGRQSFCFRRSIPGIDGPKLVPDASRKNWVDLKGNELDLEARELLKKLKHEKVPKSGIPASRMFDFKIDLLTATKEEIRSYVHEFCDLFCHEMIRNIYEGFKQQHFISDELTTELIHHYRFREKKVATVRCPSEIVAAILSKFLHENSQPIVVSGRSGSGKTTIMASAISATRAEYPHAVIVYRFIGTSMNSSDLQSVLGSVCQQIQAAYGLEPSIPASHNELVQKFREMLEIPAINNEKPLFIFLDSLDQFSGTQDLRWVPIMLATNVRLILSMLPNLAAPMLSLLPNTETHLEVLNFEPEMAKTTFHAWLRDAGRTVTKEQEELVMDAFDYNPTPLFLRMATDLALSWNSYTPFSSIAFGQTVRELASIMFEKLERKHGTLLTVRALSVITAARQGISSKNVEDILSCDDAVLNDVYQWWVPPVRRLPPLLWKRLREDLEGYLVEAGSCGVEVYKWYHRQFHEAACARYLHNHKVQQSAHAMLADLFRGESYPERLVETQPLWFSAGHPNLHKLSELPYHQTFAIPEDTAEMSEAQIGNFALFDFEFIEAKCEAGMWAQLDEDFTCAAEHIADPRMREFKRFFDHSKNNLRAFPNQALQAALHWPDSSFVRKMAASQFKERLVHSHKDIVTWRQKNQVLDTSVMTLSEHAQGDITCCAFAPNGKVFVTGSDDKSAIVWDVKSGRKLRTFILPSRVKTCAISPNGFYLLTNFHLWELGTGKLIYVFEDKLGSASVGAFSHDSTLVVTGDSTTKLWDLHSKQPLHALPDLASADVVVFSANNKYIGAASTEFRLFEASTATELFLYDEEIGCYSCAISPDNRFSLAGFSEGKLVQFEVPSGKILHEFLGHTSSVNACAITSDSNKIVSGGDNTIKIWDATTGLCLKSWDAHTDGVKKCLISPKGDFILSISSTSAKVWDFNGNLLRDLVGHNYRITSCAISPDNSAIITSSADGEVRVWDVPTALTPRSPPPYSSEISSCKISPNGKSMLTCSGNSCEVWDEKSHTILRSLAHTAEVVEVIFANDKTALTHDRGGEIRMWNIESGTLLHTLPIKVSNNLFKLSKDSKFIVMVDKEGILQSWTPDAKLLWRLPNDKLTKPRALTISPSTHMFAVSSEDKTIQVRSTRDGALRQNLLGHTDLIEAVLFTHGDRTLISGSRDNSIRVWRISDGSQIHAIYSAHQDWVFSLSISPNEKHLISSGGDGKVNHWACATWSLQKSYSTGPLNIVKWISEDRVALQSLSALLTYNAHTKRIAGSWFYPNLAVADYSSNSFVVGTSLGEVFSLGI